MNDFVTVADRPSRVRLFALTQQELSYRKQIARQLYKH